MASSSFFDATASGTQASKLRGAWWGSFMGDALAMPAHWYYHPDWIVRDYGRINSYKAPRSPHPDSILWRSHYVSSGPQDDILHEQALYWGKQGVHYHQFLPAGDNTLNLRLSMLLAESLAACAGYNPEDYLARYEKFFLEPGHHRDTYIEECHRGFFKNRARGRPALTSAVEDKHIGALATLTPLFLWYRHQPETLLETARVHVQLTHAGLAASRAVELYAQLFLALGQGESVASAFAWLSKMGFRETGHPFARWIQAGLPDSSIVGAKFSTACYLEDALPATLYLLMRYEKTPCEGLVANVHLGGDNCHRGVVLGCLLGLVSGEEGFSSEWRSGLHRREELAILGGKLIEQAPARPLA